MSVGVYDPDQQCLELRSAGTRSSRGEVINRSESTVSMEEERVYT